VRKPSPPRRPRNPVAKAVRTPQYRLRAEADKRRKALEKQQKGDAAKGRGRGEGDLEQ
jgi:hypothetical protein